MKKYFNAGLFGFTLIAAVLYLVINSKQTADDQTTGLQIPKVRCIEMCVELSKPVDDQLANTIKKCETMFADNCRLVP